MSDENERKLIQQNSDDVRELHILDRDASSNNNEDKNSDKDEE